MHPHVGVRPSCPVGGGSAAGCPPTPDTQPITMHQTHLETVPCGASTTACPPLHTTTTTTCAQGLFCAVHPLHVLGAAAVVLGLCCVGLVRLRCACARGCVCELRVGCRCGALCAIRWRRSGVFVLCIIIIVEGVQAHAHMCTRTLTHPPPPPVFACAPAHAHAHAHLAPHTHSRSATLALLPSAACPQDRERPAGPVGASGQPGCARARGLRRQLWPLLPH